MLSVPNVNYVYVGSDTIHNALHTVMRLELMNYKVVGKLTNDYVG